MTNRRILVVEDEEDILELLTFSLRRQAHTVVGAASGEEAIALLGRQTFDLVLLDIMLPGKNGFEILDYLRTETASDTPVILLSALSNTTTVTKGLAKGAVDYVTKPFSVNELLARIKLHLELKTVRDQLREAVATKEKFFRIIAHDLRGPTAAVHGYAKLLDKGYDTFDEAKRKQCITTMEETLGHVFNLLENLLAWSQAHCGNIKLHPQAVHVPEAAARETKILSPKAVDKNIHLCLAGLAPRCTVIADPTMLGVVLRNLIANAIKFTPIGGKVWLTSTSCAEGERIVVADSGVGMEQTDIDRLFRLDIHHSTRGTADEKGTGLGLILCKEFIEKNHGTLKVRSTPGQGSAFIFTLPGPQPLATLSKTPQSGQAFTASDRTVIPAA